MTERELGEALSRVLKDARPTSRFALEAFLRAVATEGVIGAELTVKYDHRQSHVEVETTIKAPE